VSHLQQRLASYATFWWSHYYRLKPLYQLSGSVRCFVTPWKSRKAFWVKSIKKR